MSLLPACHFSVSGTVTGELPLDKLPSRKWRSAFVGGAPHAWAGNAARLAMRPATTVRLSACIRSSPPGVDESVSIFPRRLRVKPPSPARGIRLRLEPVTLPDDVRRTAAPHAANRTLLRRTCGALHQRDRRTSPRLGDTGDRKSSALVERHRARVRRFQVGWTSTSVHDGQAGAHQMRA